MSTRQMSEMKISRREMSRRLNVYWTKYSLEKISNEQNV